MPLWAVIAAVCAVVIVTAVWLIAVRNRLVRARNRSHEALRGIDVALETRFDQVKAQAETASGAVSKEVEMVLGATALRTGRGIEQLSVAEKAELSGALGRAEGALLAAVEAYPEMRTQQNVELLQRTINEAEERLQAARRVYNSAATDYNTRRQVFPTVLVAGILGFRDHELFELTNAVKREQYDLKGFLDR
ncbi:LemA family protein [Brevibacterium album]|uniref:LemA family protein n=1 Tax=Brevibacterium album TaxID=417948 RepID=UPI0003FB2291|nr:LemA family protein [Brevibacterium album]